MVVTRSSSFSVRRRAPNAATPSHLIRSASVLAQTVKTIPPKHNKGRSPALAKKIAISRRRARTKKRQFAIAAEQTVDVVLGDGKYIETRRCRDRSPLANVLGHPTESLWHVVHDISNDIAFSVGNTRLYSQDFKLPPPVPTSSATRFEFTKSPTLAAVRRNTPVHPLNSNEPVQTHTGVLVQTSSQPGGDFTEGSDSFDAVVARSTSIIASLSLSSAGQQFYHTFNEQSILYSPRIVGIRRDEHDRLELREAGFDPRRDAVPADPSTSALGMSTTANTNSNNSRNITSDFVAPYVMNVLSAPSARWSSHHFMGSFEFLKARLSRVLDVFASHGDRVLVLRPDDGVPIGAVAVVYAELLACSPDETGSGRFKNVFDKVVFSVCPTRLTAFREAFEMRVLEDELNNSLSESDSE